MELRQLQYFQEIYQLRSFTKAANALFLSQQALSKSISHLEEDLGVILFIRSKGGVEPTPQADYLMKRCENLFEYIDDTRQGLSNLSACCPIRTHISLILGARPLFPVRLSDYYNEHHNFSMIELQEYPEEECLENVKNGISGAAISILPPEENPLPGCANSVYTKDSYQVYPLARAGLCCILSKSNELAKNKYIQLKDFEHQSLIQLSDWGRTNDILLKQLKLKHVHLKESLCVPNLLSALDYCQGNLGIAIVPNSIMTNITYPGVVKLLLDRAQFSWNLYYIFKKDNRCQKHILDFYNFMHNHYQF